jgi:DNA topoisomerase-1
MAQAARGKKKIQKRGTPRRTSETKNKVAPKAVVSGSSRDLVIVESPAKARTLSRMLGDKYHVEASMGHVRDLPSNDLGIDTDHDFKPKYAIIKERFHLINELRRIGKSAETVYLATDPDREGEAISWHVMEAMHLTPDRVKRVVFHEITEDAVLAAFQEPKSIDMELVNAQQARRLLDRIVGFKISPILGRKVRRGSSAGRVQSPALRMVVDREREVDAFIAKEFWTIHAELKAGDGAQDSGQSFLAKLDSIVQGPDSIVKIDLSNEDETMEIVDAVRPSTFKVQKVNKRNRRRRPAAPFITSTLQQEAWRKLRFSARKTMSVAQELYEGISLGPDGPVGLITYMRTDSTNLAEQAQQEMRQWILQKHGEKYVPKSPRVYTRKVKGAQEAHEAIRPTSIQRSLEGIRNDLSSDQARLYDLIWKRALASQMTDAIFDATSIDIWSSNTSLDKTYLFKASGQVMQFNGFLAVYEEGTDESEEEMAGKLPEMAESDLLNMVDVDPKQHFTQPPPRFNDATLVKALEEKGIGRPSTYAPTITRLLGAGYIKRDQQRFQPEKIGIVVHDLVAEHFNDIVDLDFTANMEEKLEEVARGEREWVAVLRDFYAPFAATVEKAAEAMPSVKSQLDEPTDEICEECSKPMVLKTGRFGKFLACTGFPSCRNTQDASKKIEKGCPKCNADMVERRARKTGRTFYGCSNYPTCKFVINGQPIEATCPDCDQLVIAQRNDGAKCVSCDWQGSQEELGTPDTSDTDAPPPATPAVQASVHESVEA